MYDVAIIGAGPAGLSAAINLKLHNKKIIWFGSAEFSEKIKRAPSIINYPGIGRITGKTLAKQFLAQANDLGLTITDSFVNAIIKTDVSFVLSAGEEFYEAKSILLATGSALEYSIPGEQELMGKGVHYCASCDAHLYKNKVIAVFCEREEYEEEVHFLAEKAKKVYLYTPYNSQISIDNVEKILKPMTKVLGDQQAEGLLLSDGSTILCDGIFFIRQVVGPSLLLDDLVMDGPHITIDCQGRTNLPGVYAAGDCTGKPYQIAKAVGQGSIAAYEIIKYLK